jgi:hypothetical protein
MPTLATKSNNGKSSDLRIAAMQVVRDSGQDPDDPANVELVEQVIDELLEGAGESPTLDQMYALDFFRKPPTIEEFITSSYYLGDVCNADPQNGVEGLFDTWRTALIQDFDIHSPVQQIIASGGVGLGKTWFGVICMLYKVAICLCLRDPVTYYGLSKASAITFAFFSITQKQVKGGAFSDCVKFLRSSPFFREHIKDDAQTRKYADRRIDFHNGVVIEAGSQMGEALGRNTLGAFVDEINFRREKDAALAAHEMVEAIHRRILSRFRRGNDHPGLMVLISSAQNDTDFLTQYIKDHRHDPRVRVYDYPWWEVVGPYRMQYSGETFTIDIGDSMMSPRIVDVESEILNIPPDRILQPPIEHRGEFEVNIVGSIRDLAGRGTGRTSKLFPNIVSLLNCLDDYENPFMVDSIPLSVEVNETAIWSSRYLDVKKLLALRDSKPTPMRHPAQPRFIHLDMSTGAMDALGMAMVHPVRSVEVTGYDPLTHRAMQLFKPVFELDFAIRIIRSPVHHDKSINLGKIREFIGWLRSKQFKIEMVSCDMRELSDEMRNILTANGFSAEYLSVDKKKDPYYQFKQMVEEGRFRMFDHDYLLTECANLEDLDKKIDHPETFPPCVINGVKMLDLQGSKDMSDGVAAACYKASESQTTTGQSDPRSRSDILNGLVMAQAEPAEGWMTVGVRPDRPRTF